MAVYDRIVPKNFAFRLNKVVLSILSESVWVEVA